MLETSVGEFQQFLHTMMQRNLDRWVWQAIFSLKQKEDDKIFYAYDELINCNEVLSICELVVSNVPLPYDSYEFRCTLSCNDPPVLSGCTHCLINDLDLFVRSKESGLVFFLQLAKVRLE